MADALLPPAINLILLLAGFLFRRWRGLSLSLITLAILSLYMASISAVSRQLIQGLETHGAILPQDVSNHQAQAIVVLGGGVYKHAREYGGAIPDAATLERTHYAAYLHNITGLPILASGGDDLNDGKRPAAIMRETLIRDYGIPEAMVWAEIHSLDTFQNAVLSSSLLEKKAIHVDEKGLFSVNDEIIEDTVAALAKELLMIQALGDYEAAQAFHAKYMKMTPQMQAVIDRMDEIPVDVDPVYAVGGEGGSH